MIRILFSFLGHTRWTFKGKGDSVLKSSVKFIGWEIFMMIVLVNILVILRKYMNIILSIISDRNIIGEWFVTPNPNKHPIDISNSRSSLDPDMISRKDLERLLGHKLNDTTIGEIDSDGGDLLNYDKVMYYYNSDYVYRPWVFIFLKQFLAIAMYFMIDIPVYKLIFS